jgi:hypothetical protein
LRLYVIEDTKKKLLYVLLVVFHGINDTYKFQSHSTDVID